MLAEVVQEQTLVVVVSVLSGNVDFGWRTAHSSGWIFFVVVAWRCCCYYRCPARVEMEVHEGDLAVAVASEAVDPSVLVGQ